MTWLDYSSYTEQDTASYLAYSGTSNEIYTGTAIPRNLDEYAYKDYGANFFDTDFVDDFKLNVSSFDNYALIAGPLYADGTGVNDFAYLRANVNCVSVYVYKTTTTYDIYIEEANAGTYYYTSYAGLSASTDYFCRLKRDEAVGTYGTLYLDIYTSEANRTAETSAVANLSVTLHTSKKDFRYHYPICSYNTGSAVAGTYVISEETLSAGTAFQAIEVGTVAKSRHFAHDGPLNTFGTVAHNDALCLPHQVGSTFDGTYHHVLVYTGDGTTTVKPTFGFMDAASGVCCDLITVTTSTMPAVNRAYKHGMSGRYRQSYSCNTVAESGEVCSYSNENQYFGQIEESGFTLRNTTSAGISDYPNPEVDAQDYTWLGGNDGSTKAQVVRSTEATAYTTWEDVINLKTFADANTAVKVVTYENFDVGFLYANGTSGALTLYYRHWTEGIVYGTITGATAANPCVLTITGHSYTINSVLYLANIVGNMGTDVLNDGNFEITAVTTNTVTINADTTGKTYTSGGNAQARGLTGSEETVATDLGYFYNFDGTVDRDGNLVVVYRKYETSGYNTLRYNTRLSGSSWGTAADFCTDCAGAANTDCYFSITANLGEASQIYLSYYDTSSNIVYRTYDFSTISSKTTIVTPTSLYSDHITTPNASFLEYAVAYCDTLASGNHLKLASVTLSQTQASTADATPTITADPNLGTPGANTNVLTSGNTTIVIWASHDGWSYARLLDNSTNTWISDEVKLGYYRYWDGHNVPDMFLSDDDYVFVILGGRQAKSGGGGVDQDLRVFKSAATLANMTAINFRDISPSASTSGRGYKRAIVDNYGVLYVFYQKTDYCYILEYRNNTWSSTTTIFDFSATATDLEYVNNITLGREASGQKTIHMTYSYRDTVNQPSVPGGSIMQIQVFYMKILPGGDGTFTATKGSGSSQTLPATKANADAVYNAVSAGDYPRLAADIEIYNTADPIIVVSKRDRNSPYSATTLDSYTYSSGWNKVEIENTNLDDACIPEIIRAPDGTLFCAVSKIVSGISEIFYYNSLDNGATWAAAPAVTSGSSYNNYIPELSPKSGAYVNLINQQRLSRLHAELLLNQLQIFEPAAIFHNHYMNQGIV